jgi:phosphotransferase system enzyme I (PtsP)
VAQAGGSSISGARILLRRLREIMGAGGPAQERLDRLVQTIAATMVADVCSIYLKRGRMHELFSTEGLKAEAVHRTQLAEGEGLVGLVAETARPLNIADAPHHPRFAYRPETGEDPFLSFLGVPIVRSERVFGVLVVQNRVARLYGEDEVEALQTIAMVLAEMVASGVFGDLSGLQEVEVRPSLPERLAGKAYSDGLAIGTVVLHEPHAPLGRLIADDPVAEEARLATALAQVRADLDRMLESEGVRLSGVSQEVLETFRMLVDDASWVEKIQSGVRSGLSADAAVERVRGEHRSRMQAAKDPYLRERMQDLEDLDNRVLRALAGRRTGLDVPNDAILVARDLGPAELLDYPIDRLKAVALEEGGATSHAVIVARALGIPMVGRLHGLLSRVEAGDAIVVDGELGEVRLRPEGDVTTAYRQRVALRSVRTAAYARLKDLPSVTIDGATVSLQLNAGLVMDVQHIADTGAEGVGLFRTEFQFMVGEALPRLKAQTELYRSVLDAAGDLPVTFRTLDLGGDKVLPYMSAEREENPALGWRAIRIGLDRPALLRYQLRALIEAAEGRNIRIMFPLVATVSEFVAARAFVDRELDWARSRGRKGPASVDVGAMLEAPALAWAIDQLAGHAAFLSVGTNDLMQYFFAADRGNPRVSDRYDLLSPPALRLMKHIATEAQKAGIALSVCGEAAGRPLEAMALIGLGFRTLSMPAAGIGPVKAMLRSLDAGAARKALSVLCDASSANVRQELLLFAQAHSVEMP